jgi:formate/nitrite transporter FocA (FNT family)
MGGKGFFFAYIKAIMCNWLVCYGVTMSMVSTTAIGRIAAMWLPIFTFFYLGYEHLIVNFFVIPTGIMFGAETDVGKMILWNWIPVFFGNMTGGLILGMHHQYMHAPAPAPPASKV